MESAAKPAAGVVAPGQAARSAIVTADSQSSPNSPDFGAKSWARIGYYLTSHLQAETLPHSIQRGDVPNGGHTFLKVPHI